MISSADQSLARLTGLTLNPETPPHQPHDFVEDSEQYDAAEEEEDEETEDIEEPPETLGKGVNKESAAGAGRTEDLEGEGDEGDVEVQGADSSRQDGHTTPIITVRSLVTTKEAGVIIGKGGKNVAEVRAETGVRAGVSKVVPGAHERILTISGTTLSVAKAYSIIGQHLLDNPVSTQPSNYADCTTIRLLVPHQLMGSIIGKGGSKIKEIQEESGAKLVIAKEMLPQSTERVIEVYGLVESIKIAVYNIAECIFNDLDRATGAILYNPQVRASLSHSNSNNGSIPRTGRFDEYTSRDGGFRSGPRRRGSAQDNHSNYNNSSSTNGSYNNSNSTNANSSSHISNGGFRRYPADSSQHPPSHSSGRANGSYSPVNNRDSRDRDSDQQTQTMAIPSDMVGCVIGKGGSFISSIRRQSNARLRISEAIEGSSERIITVTGTSTATAKAMQMIQEQLSSEKQRRANQIAGDEDD
ncbi:RNA binding protein, heterogenous nuclear RNP-K like protein [Blyttiomyces sp. JEL0837]|nr:RNA binding protein, heterogenous nuclear RNP-K like protein [Blyttiomyces sp. JEL0837]